MNTLTLAAFLLAVSPADSLPGTSDQILRQHVDSSGVASKELAEQTGWSVLRGLRWRVLLVDSVGGGTTPVDPKTVFKTGQRFQVEVEAHVCDLWVYLLTVDPQGSMAVLFPEQAEGHRLVRKGEKMVVPPGGDWLRFEGPPGKDLLRMIASPTKLRWVNPRELFELEGGETLSGGKAKAAQQQGSYRSKSVSRITSDQRKTPVDTRSLPELISAFRSDPQLRARSKNVSLVPPPQGTETGSQPQRTSEEVIVTSDDRSNRDPLIVDVELAHGGAP
ncbi:MAG: DUF4384 domain-containing protein [Planctomycetes bacterium]|nr:DUF4384 domain-containing protein [Planctomycetota bacterium]